MQFATVDPIAVLVAAILNIVVAMIWYQPRVFGNTWAAALGKTSAELKLPRTAYALAILGSLVVAFVLGEFVSYARAGTLVGGALIGALAWFGLKAATDFSDYLMEGRPPKLYWVNSGFWLVSLVVMGAVLGAWR